MSISLTMRPSERLANVLKANKDKFSVSYDGFITLNMDNERVQQEIERQIEMLGVLENQDESFEL